VIHAVGNDLDNLGDLFFDFRQLRLPGIAI